MADSGAYAFRAVMAEDLPLLTDWLRTPEVVRWWGDPEAQAALIEEDLSEPLMAMRIVSLAGAPFAYIQDYDVHSWPQHHLADLPKGARAIDAFIGLPEMIGKGHGAAFLKLRALRLLAAGAPLVAIDPAADNVRAQRSYAKAGFQRLATVDAPQGRVVLMTFGGPRR